jgi:WXXGXW repeat (2 copies)
VGWADGEWIAGFHRWDGHRYVWVGGRWDHRPHAGAHWVGAHWEPRARGKVWVEGHWD